MEDQKPKLLQQVLNACERDYGEKSATFQQLDGKAQSNAAIAGILIAACVTLFQEDNLKAMVGHYGLAGPRLIALVIVSSLISVVLALICMLVRKVESPPESDELSKMVDELMALERDELSTERLENFTRDQIRIWRRAIKDLSGVNAGKAKWLLGAQWTLAFAFFVVTLGVGVFLWSFR
jgi:hypothetical protein